MNTPDPGTRLGWPAQAAALVALVVNLWFGGDIVEAWLGGAWLAHVVRSVLELSLIGGWLILVVGMRAPWRRPPPEEIDRERRR